MAAVLPNPTLRCLCLSDGNLRADRARVLSEEVDRLFFLELVSDWEVFICALHTGVEGRLESDTVVNAHQVTAFNMPALRSYRPRKSRDKFSPPSNWLSL